MFCATWYHLYNLKTREKLPWRNVTFSKVAGFTKSNTPPWVFFTFFKLFKWYQIAQRITSNSIKKSKRFFTEFGSFSIYSDNHRH